MGRPRTYQKPGYRFSTTTRNKRIIKLCESLKKERKLNKTVEKLLLNYIEEKK